MCLKRILEIPEERSVWEAPEAIRKAMIRGTTVTTGLPIILLSANIRTRLLRMELE